GADDEVDELHLLALAQHVGGNVQTLADRNGSHDVDGQSGEAHRCQRRHVLEDVSEQGEDGAARLAAVGPRALRAGGADEGIAILYVERFRLAHWKSVRSRVSVILMMRQRPSIFSYSSW